MAGTWTPTHARLAEALTPILGGVWWDRRWEVAWYVNLCEMAGFCQTDDMRRICAQRYMAGKRKVTLPGTQRRKAAERERRRLLRNMPPELTAAIDLATNSLAAQQYAEGNDKALNAVVGMVLKQYKAEPSLVRELLAAQLRPNVQLEPTPERAARREPKSAAFGRSARSVC